MATAPAYFLNIDQVTQATTLSARRWRELVAKKEAPAPRQLSGNRVAWLAREIEEWAEARPVAAGLPPSNTGWRRNQKTQGLTE